MPGVLTRPKGWAVRAKKKIATCAHRNGFTEPITRHKKQRPGERPIALDDPARRVACRRAHGATGGATQEEPFARPRGALSRPHGARGRESGRRPRRARRTGRRPLDAARRPRPAAGRPRALAPGPGASERAAAAVAHVARAGQRAPSPADGSRGLGRPARNFPRRPPATRSRRGTAAPGRACLVPVYIGRV